MLEINITPNKPIANLDLEQLALAISKNLPCLQQPTGSIAYPEQILKVFNNKIRRAPIQGSKEKLLQTLTSKLDANEKISFVLYHGSRKNPNALPYKTADLADAFSLAHIVHILNSVGALYDQGAEITLIMTGQRSIEVNHIDKEEADVYEKSLLRLINYLEYTDSMKMTTLAKLYTNRRKELETAEEEICPKLEKWWQQKSNVEEVNQLREHAIRFAAPDELPKGKDMNKEINARAFKFKLRHLAEYKINLLENAFPDSIYLTYDSRSGRTAIPLKTSFGGNAIQPWQGMGGLSFNGKQYIPYTITQKRKHLVKQLDVNINVDGKTIQRGFGLIYL